MAEQKGRTKMGEEKAGGAARGSPELFCAAVDEWAALFCERDAGFREAWHTVRSAISKSCLLDRMLYGGERPSQTPCPVHKGRWSGCHFGWPGQMWSDGEPVEESGMLREWYDAGCRCAKHSCGCTTGWQPEEASSASAPKEPPEPTPDPEAQRG